MVQEVMRSSFSLAALPMNWFAIRMLLCRLIPLEHLPPLLRPGLPRLLLSPLHSGSTQIIQTAL
jgi:hypothetical protein